MSDLADAQARLNLLTRLVAMPEREASAPGQAGLTRLREFVRTELRDFVRSGWAPRAAMFLVDLEQELERFADFVTFPVLASKVVVGLGGAFSAGKSTFLNCLLGMPFLPVHLDPTTAVPTYVLSASEAMNGALNLFDRIIPMESATLKEITHAFTEELGISPAALLKAILHALPVDLPGEHLVFLDTPGYDKPEATPGTAYSDEALARAQLNTCHHILWLVNGEQPTLRQDDLDFLAKLDPEIPLLVVVSKADKILPDEMETGIAGIRSLALERGLKLVDVVPFTKQVRARDTYPLEAITKHLERWGSRQRPVVFPERFKQFFVGYSSDLENRKREEYRRLGRLKKVLVQLDGDPEVYEEVNYLRQEVELSLKGLKDQEATLKHLTRTFFSLLKAIGDEMNIPLPDPDLIDITPPRDLALVEVLQGLNADRGVHDPDLHLDIHRLLTGEAALTAERVTSDGKAREYERKVLDMLSTAKYPGARDPAADIARWLEPAGMAVPSAT